MVVWSTFAALALSALTLGPLREAVPGWAADAAELVAVAAAFVLICLLESGAPGGPDAPSPPA